MADFKKIIEESFIQYSGAVLQSRALIDVRDCIKPSTRQILYALYTDKFTSNKPFKKTLKAVGSLSRFYIHGDASAVGVLMRSGQNFSMRYPLISVKGNVGTLMESGNWASQRYTESRLSPVSEQLFTDINKDTIEDWRDNYDNTEKYPAVLPSKGFYNIVNGTLGIGIGAASSIPPFNLTEVNTALIKLLWNPNIPYEEIYCPPDFPTGGTILNEDEVKESLKKGTGFACKIRSKIEYDKNEKILTVKEIPYGVYTNTISKELETILNSEDNPGIDRFNDLTGLTPLIKIYLTKKANVQKVLTYLYKNTSLQSFYGINMTMLKDGRFPQVFGWKEALTEFLKHQISVYTKGFEYDYKVILNKIHIIEGLLKAISIIDEVIALIKSSSSSKVASENLQSQYGFSSEQAQAILNIKLARLAHLEVNKLEKEREDLKIEFNRIKDILQNPDLLKKEIEKDLQQVMNKYGDSRRTELLNVEKENEEPVDVKSLIINLTNQNSLFVSENSSLFSQKRGGVGNKFKLNKGEYILSTISAENVDNLLLFSNKGMVYNTNLNQLPLEEKIPIESICSIPSSEKINCIVNLNKKTENKNIIFFSKKGMLKKSLLSEYNMKRKNGLKALELNKEDELCSTLILNDEKVGLLTSNGNFLYFSTKTVNPVGRIAKGVKSIKLNDNDFVVSAKIIPNATDYLVSISNKGLIKKTDFSEFNIGSRYTKGVKIQKNKEEDKMADFLPIFKEDKSVIITSTKAQIKIDTSEISTLGKGTYGNKSIKMPLEDKIVSLTKF